MHIRISESPSFRNFYALSAHGYPCSGFEPTPAPTEGPDHALESTHCPISSPDPACDVGSLAAVPLGPGPRSGTGCVVEPRLRARRARLGRTDVSGFASALDTKPDDEDALFDLTYVPGLHLDLETFSANEAGSHYPAGHQHVRIRSWLPLFMFVDGDVAHFDVEHAAYEQSTFRAILWGLWARSETKVQTRVGERVERSGRLLWLIDWDDAVEYGAR